MSRINKVKDLMVPVGEYPVISDRATVAEAIDTLSSCFHEKDGTWYGFQSLLVLDKKGNLTGILTLRGLLKAFKIQAVYDHLLKGDPSGIMFIKSFGTDMSITVRDIMRPIKLVTVQENSNILEAVQIVCRKKVNSLPVMAGQKLVGIVRTLDLFWSVGELLEG